MQSWNSVKVTNSESLHAGRAGCVVRVEKKDGLSVVQVRLDPVGNPGEDGHLPGEMEPFFADELAIL